MVGMVTLMLQSLRQEDSINEQTKNETTANCLGFDFFGLISIDITCFIIAPLCVRKGMSFPGQEKVRFVMAPVNHS
jgi:hypothetical protein